MIYATQRVDKRRLNPCCNGIYLMIAKQRKEGWQKLVLILVVMEYT